MLAEIVDSISHGAPEPHAAVSERHRALLEAALGSVHRAIGEASRYRSGEEDTSYQVACHVRQAAYSVGQLTGRVYSDELLDAIFSRFCIGK